MLPESLAGNSNRLVPKGYQSINTVPGLGSIASRTLLDHNVRNLADLARLDPYDERFTKLGEDFPRWVLHARTVVADEVIRGIEVRNDAIFVSAAKNYDREATLKSVLGRLGVYYIYVDTDVRERGDEYEITIRLKPEQYPFAQAQWNEYKANASLLQELRKQRVVVSKWRSLKELDDLLTKAFSSSKDILLLSKLCLRLHLARALNLMVIWKAGSANKTSTQLLIRNLFPRVKHLTLGNSSQEKLAEAASLCREGWMIMVDDWARAEGEERGQLLEAMAYPKLMPDDDAWSKRGAIILNCWAAELEKLEPDLLGLFDIAMVMPDREGKDRLVQMPEQLRNSEADLSEIDKLLARTMERELRITAAPQNLEMKNVKHEGLTGFSPDMNYVASRLAMAEAKLNLRERVEDLDYKEAYQLLNMAISSLELLSTGKGKKKSQRSR
ncbi:MAG: hypothetical protein QXV32_08205 [Conexivisphaerales archaeon]